MTVEQTAASPHPAQHERCAVDATLLAELGAVSGQQARIILGEAVALFTLIESPLRAAADVVGLTRDGMQRLHHSGRGAAVIDLQVVRSDLGADEARHRSEFVELLLEATVQHDLIALAPHGGAVEKYTDLQAEYLSRAIGHDRASAWTCRGWHAGGGAFRKWHITSNDISEHSFPLLRTIMQRRFRHALAFHGYRGDEVLIGGGADHRLKTEVQHAVTGALTGSGIRVRAIPPGAQYGGDDPANLVNRITIANSGIQLEQSRKARQHYGIAIAAAVAEVYRRHHTSPRLPSTEGDHRSLRTPRPEGEIRSGAP